MIFFPHVSYPSRPEHNPYVRTRTRTHTHHSRRETNGRLSLCVVRFQSEGQVRGPVLTSLMQLILHRVELSGNTGLCPACDRWAFELGKERDWGLSCIR